ncbi:helix-turn-helix domain-containing protein [Aeromonas caviae]|uniref:helix-turn-helix domain-containing protein n=1 Tax=Aeromonas caviae TaxID=648 RepID=UPI00388ABB55
MTIVDRINSLMLEQGVRPAQLARMTGLTQAGISAMLSDPTKDMLASSFVAICRALRCNSGQLLTGVGGCGAPSDAIAHTWAPVYSNDELTPDVICKDATVEASPRRRVVVGEAGHFIALEVADDTLKSVRVYRGQIAIVDMNDRTPLDGKVYLADVIGENQTKLLLCREGIRGIIFCSDDRSSGAIPLNGACIRGKLVELRTYKKASNQTPS